MATVRLVPEEEATGRTKEIYAELKASLGIVPNIYRALANNEHILETFWENRKRIMDQGKLDPNVKEWLAWATVSINNAKFGVDTHSARLKKLGYGDDELIEALAVINYFVGISTAINGLGMVNDTNAETLAALRAAG